MTHKLQKRLICPSDVDITSVESSNGTQSDLPGAGRTFGHVLSVLGRRIECFLNDAAGRLDLGPAPLVRRIIERECRIHLRNEPNGHRGSRLICVNGDGEGTDMLSKKQREDVFKLIRYTKSKTETTRKQALEGITELAWQSSSLVEILRLSKAIQFMREQEPFIWDFCDMSLQLHSRTAIACIEEGKLSRLLESYRGPVASDPAHWTTTVLTKFIQMNPEELFLALRLLAGHIQYMFLYKVECVLIELKTLTENMQDLIEWEELDILFRAWFDKIYLQRQYSERSEEILGYMLQYCAGLPKTLASTSFQIWLLDLKKPKDTRAHFLLASALVFENISVPIHRHIEPFFNTCDLALGRLSLLWGPGTLSRFSYPKSTEVSEAYGTLAECLDSKNDFLRRRALLCIAVILSHDAYSRSSMINVLKQTSFANSCYFSRLLALTEERCIRQVGTSTSHEAARTIYFIRHCDSRGAILHVGRAASCALFEYQCASEYRLQLTLGDVMLMEFKRGEPVRFPDDVVPLCAGRASEGRKTYLGWRYAGAYNEECYILESMRPEEMRMCKGTLVPDKVQVIVLRYSPEIYANNEREAESLYDEWSAESRGQYDKTGPFGWRIYARLQSSKMHKVDL